MYASHNFTSLKSIPWDGGAHNEVLRQLQHHLGTCQRCRFSDISQTCRIRHSGARAQPFLL